MAKAHLAQAASPLKEREAQLTFSKLGCAVRVLMTRSTCATSSPGRFPLRPASVRGRLQMLLRQTICSPASQVSRNLASFTGNPHCVTLSEAHWFVYPA
jgi:hypothetical protein